MCGIVGFFSNKTLNSPIVVRNMADRINYRGPDDSGVWVDNSSGIALAHRRLSIVDLSPAGHQPMESRSGRFVIVFNGEIYNHLDLRKILKIDADWSAWKGHSDTETLLSCIEVWGVEKTLREAVGMFAIAVWDRKEEILTLARDRFGEKPLFYGWSEDSFLFGSELKALRQFPGFSNPIDRGSLTLFMRHGYVPSPHSIYHGILKLPPGCFLEVTKNDLLSKNINSPVFYWSINSVVKQSVHDQFSGSDSEACKEVDRLIVQSVAGQMVADVPIGAFLSGGVDSSTIVAVMQSLANRPVKTFTIGFHESGFNEAEHAKAVSKHLGTEHTELYVSPRQALDLIPRLPFLYDEPFADVSQIPTFLVCEMTKRHVTVSLSGDAGDELFCGYNRYFLGNNLAGFYNVPFFLRNYISKSLRAISPEVWDLFFRALGGVLPKNFRYKNFGDKLHKLAGVLNQKSKNDIFKYLVSQWHDPSLAVIGGYEPSTPITDYTERIEGVGFQEQMMYLDTLTYLPDDILVKVDRASMGVSLETRVPLLDHRLFEFAWRLPMSMKIRDGASKWIMRQVLYNYVPKELIERPKMGFSVPLAEWLRGPLRDWAENLLSESRLHQEGYFHPLLIRKKWEEHLSGRRNWQEALWNVLMFQAWLEEERR